MTEDLSREAADPLCLPPEEAVRLLSDAPWRRFAVMGDSFAQGVGGPSHGYAETPWPQRIATALGTGRPDFTYLNTGVLGKRTAEVRGEQLNEVLAFKPDLVNVAVGGNDLFSPEPDFDGVERDLDAVYSALRAQGADIFAFTVANVFDAVPQLAEFGERVAELNSRTRAVAERHQAVLVDMWDHPVRLRSGLMSADGIHFTMEGQAALAAEIFKALSQRLSPSGAEGRV